MTQGVHPVLHVTAAVPLAMVIGAIIATLVHPASSMSMVLLSNVAILVAHSRPQAICAIVFTILSLDCHANCNGCTGP